ncbi:MAG TPA: HAMP domain-containing sensor histidine kinase, partial [Deinococcales bacterium]|nr:HAMP domain-containing sensor histidine kinase [Deinococcales bacterium]
ASSVREALDAFHACVSEVAGTAFAVIFELRDDRLGATTFSGQPPAALAEDLKDGLARGEGIIWKALDGEAVYVPQTPVERYRQRGVGAAAYIRLQGADGEPERVLVTAKLGPPLEWTAQERTFLEAAARSVSLAVKRVGVLKALNERNLKLEEQNEQLTRQRNELEAFAYTVSHDLRSPLLSIQGMGALLEAAVHGGDAEEASFLLERVYANVGRMQMLLNDILTISRIGRTEEEPVEVDLRELAGSVLEELDQAVSTKRVRIDLPERVPPVRLPPTEARQVITNLLTNAVKFSGREGSSPLVRVSWREGEGGRVALTVADNGPGIEPRFREKVFNLFARLQTNVEGTGVGLAIVKRIVERHGGRVQVEDSRLGGAAFTVELPRASNGP